MRPHFLVAAALFASASYVAVGCASPPAPLPQGAWVLTFMHTGASCVINTHNTMIGMIDATSATKLVTQGVNNASVTCTVAKNGGGFDIDAEVLATGSDLHIIVKGLTAAASPTAPVQGQLGYISPNTQNSFSSTVAHPCNFYFSDPKETVTPGNAFLSFDCPEVDYGMQACGIGGGHIKVVNCDGGAPT